VLDQLDARGAFAAWKHEPAPALFVPDEHGTNEPLGPDAT
jgi:hypothetical protein